MPRRANAAVMALAVSAVSLQSCSDKCQLQSGRDMSSRRFLSSNVRIVEKEYFLCKYHLKYVACASQSWHMNVWGELLAFHPFKALIGVGFKSDWD